MMLLLSSVMALAADLDCVQTASAQSRGRIERVVAQTAQDFDTPDSRSYITQPRLTHYKISAQDEYRIRKTTGVCTCPGVISSCGLGADGEMIISNSHLYINEQGQNRKPLSACAFQNQAIPPDPPVSMVFKDGTFRIGSLHPYGEGEQINDHAVVKTSGPVTGARPFAIDPLGTKLQPGQWILAVSGTMINLPSGMKQDLRTPIVQECQVTNTNYAASISGYFGSTCRGFRGSSGSFNFTRAATGELQLVGIMVSTCAEKGSKDQACEKGTRTDNIAVRKYFLNDIMEVGKSSRLAQAPGGGKEL